jgi:hypothetical protein
VLNQGPSNSGVYLSLIPECHQNATSWLGRWLSFSRGTWICPCSRMVALPPRSFPSPHLPFSPFEFLPHLPASTCLAQGKPCLKVKWAWFSLLIKKGLQEYYSAIKKNGAPSRAATCTGFEDITFSERSLAPWLHPSWESLVSLTLEEVGRRQRH